MSNLKQNIPNEQLIDITSIKTVREGTRYYQLHISKKINNIKYKIYDDEKIIDCGEITKKSEIDTHKTCINFEYDLGKNYFIKVKYTLFENNNVFSGHKFLLSNKINNNTDKETEQKNIKIKVKKDKEKDTKEESEEESEESEEEESSEESEEEESSEEKLESSSSESEHKELNNNHLITKYFENKYKFMKNQYLEDNNTKNKEKEPYNFYSNEIGGFGQLFNKEDDDFDFNNI